MVDDRKRHVKGAVLWILVEAGNLKLEGESSSRTKHQRETEKACAETRLSLNRLRVGSFLRYEFLALAQNAIRLLWVWIGPHGGAAIRPVRRLRMAADA